MTLLSLSGVALSHPASRERATLLDMELRVERGETVAVIGPSGAGKTTLLHGIALALRPSAGELRLFGEAAWPKPRRAQRARLFLAPQVPPLPPRQRVVTAVLAGRLPRQGLASSLRSLFWPSGTASASAALARFELADKLYDRVDRLSGGERQRVGLARALVALEHGAELLLVDEPLSALDRTRAAQAIDSLLAATRERGATLVCTLHQVEVALARFPRIVGLRHGRIAFDLPAAAVHEALLHQLYTDYEDELFSQEPATDSHLPLPVDAAPVPQLGCR
jgi:phosphonate transport system ATP-binding protein